MSIFDSNNPLLGFPESRDRWAAATILRRAGWQFDEINAVLKPFPQELLKPIPKDDPDPIGLSPYDFLTPSPSDEVVIGKGFSIKNPDPVAQGPLIPPGGAILPLKPDKPVSWITVVGIGFLFLLFLAAL